MLRKILLTAAILGLTAAELPAQLVFDPPMARQINFPDTPVGQTSELGYTATSRGNGPWTVRLNSNRQEFACVPNEFQVPDGGLVPFVLRFSPQQVGQVQGVLSGAALSPDGLAMRLQNTLIGTGTNPQRPNIVVAPEALLFELWVDNFGTLWDFTVDSLAVSNDGNADLTVQDVTVNVQWLTVARRQFVVRPNQTAQLIVSIPENQWANMEPDLYEGLITIISNDPDTPRLEVPVAFDRGLVPHYLIELPEGEIPSHSMMVDELTINGEEVDFYDEIGVFTPRGDLAGSGWYDGEMPILVMTWAEVQNFPGFRRGESFVFTIYDHDQAEELDASAEFVQGPQTFTPDEVSIVALTSPPFTRQVIPMLRGWSLISSNHDFAPRFIDQEGPDMQLILAGILNRMELIKDGAGRFCFPAFNFWGIPFWNTADGYLIKIADSTALTIEGVSIPFNRPIRLRAGWNMIAYYPDYRLTFAAALRSLVNQDLVEIAKKGNGQFCVPRFGFGGDILIYPNEGLQLKVTRDCELVYPPR